MPQTGYQLNLDQHTWLKYMLTMLANQTRRAQAHSYFQAGSGNNDEWFFDYQSGVLNFNGTNIPSQIGTGITGKSIYIVGARYIGPFGVGGGTGIGNLTVTDTTFSTNNAGSDIGFTTTGQGTIEINNTTALNISVGTTAQRPQQLQQPVI